MGWIDVNDRMPPEGLEVLLEVSGWTTAPYSEIWDHDFCLGSWIVPERKEGRWLLRDGLEGDDYHIISPKVHAWMPLPEHYKPKESFRQGEELMEHAMFEDDPEWLYKGDAVYEPRQEVREKKRPKKQPEENLGGQMTIIEFLQNMEE